MNAPGYDYTKGEIKGEFKCLTKGGIAFRRSMYTGVRRECDSKKVRESIARVEFYVVADVKEFPIVYFIKLTTGFVAQWHEDGTLGKENGHVSWEKFYASLGEVESVVWPREKETAK